MHRHSLQTHCKRIHCLHKICLLLLGGSWGWKLEDSSVPDSALSPQRVRVPWGQSVRWPVSRCCDATSMRELLWDNSTVSSWRSGLKRGPCRCKRGGCWVGPEWTSQRGRCHSRQVGGEGASDQGTPGSLSGGLETEVQRQFARSWNSQF